MSGRSLSPRITQIFRRDLITIAHLFKKLSVIFTPTFSIGNKSLSSLPGLLFASIRSTVFLGKSICNQGYWSACGHCQTEQLDALFAWMDALRDFHGFLKFAQAS